MNVFHRSRNTPAKFVRWDLGFNAQNIKQQVLASVFNMTVYSHNYWMTHKFLVIPGLQNYDGPSSNDLLL